MSEEQKPEGGHQEGAEAQAAAGQAGEDAPEAAGQAEGGEPAAAAEDLEKLDPSAPEAAEEHGEAQEEAEEHSEPAASTMSVPQPLPQLGATNRLSKEEIAYGCTFFSNAHGYQNPLNVITAQALQTRLQPVSNMSIHHAGALLRPPFSEKNSRNFADTKEMQDLQLKTLAPCEITDIMNYRVSGCDDVDFAVQSFKMLGAKDENDKVPISRLSSLLIDCYQQLDYQLECIDDYKLHCEAVRAQLEADSKKDQNTRAPPSNKKAEQEFILAPEEDILQVILMANGGRDELTLDDWRALFKNITQLEFVDYKKQIQQQRLM